MQKKRERQETGKSGEKTRLCGGTASESCSGGAAAVNDYQWQLLHTRDLVCFSRFSTLHFVYLQSSSFRLYGLQFVNVIGLELWINRK